MNKNEFRNGSRFEGTTTQSLFDMAKDIGEIKEMLQLYERRISNLEKWKWILTGGILVLTASKFPMIAHFLSLQ